jgi:type II secretory pathway pseudopilin PulG
MKFTKAAAPPRGFTYLGLMFVIGLLAMTAAMASTLWSTIQQRADERELAFVGRQFQSAIERFRLRQFDGTSRYPANLEELLRDARGLKVERHLRRLYIDPMTGRAQWGLVRLADGGVVGVFSLSRRAPMDGSVLARELGFAQATSYRGWRFVAASALASAKPSRATPRFAPGHGADAPEDPDAQPLTEVFLEAESAPAAAAPTQGD